MLKIPPSVLHLLNQSKLKHVSQTLPSIVRNQFFLVTVLIVFETFGIYPLHDIITYLL